MARPNTPDRINPDGPKTIKMKRACNGCGSLLGDVTEQEMAAGINGRPLPDVRRECPTCAPTAPEPKCQPTTIYAGDTYCLYQECDHDPVGRYCTEVREETVCNTHSRFVQAEDDFGELVHGEPWPCKQQEAAA
ncbi:hypothetical protein GCM10010348_77380 [Streptomyces anthocyanicus]|uniref:hypothetical protein n=1 Tax=Streptomyces anthocyanicus TaxID=68174 RepID=UPI001876B83A|nr:hypothetical protein [Streptomyces anthocyanicus]GHC38541.1 hypothetical protein GCM10010348_77380 [Streptomyces anthocyanicus]